MWVEYPVKIAGDSVNTVILEKSQKEIRWVVNIAFPGTLVVITVMMVFVRPKTSSSNHL